MIQFKQLSHINIVVDEIEEATRFYRETFFAEPFLDFPHFRNSGFARSAGFLDQPESVEVSIRFLILPSEDELKLELMQYHSPQGEQEIRFKKTNDLGGPRHVAMNVTEIDAAFEHIKKQPGVRLINSAPEYRPFRIDEISDNEFSFFDDELNKDPDSRQGVRKMVAGIRYFYFIDPYGVQWEFEQKPD
ncbi:VOC family protein [Endozoicomonas arenosclerae]|uniref:VOC family protein n=1 Tax=Endozoicomonas arenosclerae TaxID=1633495 RepID=UPI0007813995|nr:VOC family protein [Endozoicomonas arenosclerae]